MRSPSRRNAAFVASVLVAALFSAHQAFPEAGAAANKAMRQERSRMFHHPDPNPVTYGRVISTVTSGQALWAIVQKRSQGREFPNLFKRQGDETADSELPVQGSCHQPSLAPIPSGGVAAVWNEARDEDWALQFLEISPNGDISASAETIATHPDLILPPAATFLGDTPYVAWSAPDSGNLRIHLSRRVDGQWRALLPHVSRPGLDTFRPCLASNGTHLFLAWDQYRDSAYEVCLTIFDGQEWSDTQTLRHPGERWFSPRVIAGQGPECFLTWVVLQEVTDDLGIVDHVPFAMVAQASPDAVTLLLDKSNPQNDRIVADLREGLLASQKYIGYHGLRRNPHLTRGHDGVLWCLWESRIEGQDNHLEGHLFGRSWTPGSGWSPPSRLHDGGTCYAAAPHAVDGKLSVACYEYGLDPERMTRLEYVDPAQGQPHASDPDRWKRWQATTLTPPSKSKRTVSLDGKEYRFFWADTHCHSAFSPDAEGQPDELIHFGRDLAGLDAIAVTDNDYYPHKALSEAEWRVHQGLAKHFTQNGRFVVFPGWEYTYHRTDVEPDFNHRIIFYPRPGPPIYRRIDPATHNEAGLYPLLAQHEVVSYPHHTTYDIIAPDIDRNVEICSSWRVVMEESTFTIEKLSQGQHTGFIGSSDSHRSVPGLGGALTGILATDLTPESLYEAYQARRLVATQGNPVAMAIWAGTAFMGSEGTSGPAPQIRGWVEAPETIEFVEVLRDGAPIARHEPNAKAHEFDFLDKDAAPGSHYYFLRVKLAGEPGFNTDPAEDFRGAFKNDGLYPHNAAKARGPFAWSSPVWLNIQP